MSLYTHYKVYHAISLQPSSSIASISSLAMLVYGASGIPDGLARAKARSLWDSAEAHSMSPVLAGHGTRKQAQAFEVLVLKSMDVSEAVERLSEASEEERRKVMEGGRINLLRCLGACLSNSGSSSILENSSSTPCKEVDRRKTTRNMRNGRK